ncbi:heavy metal translocating P-type ATPase [Neobacillus ginsengisoli]|uniref:Cd(2+)-exporting ATPase n=1 Tax=Neobacillus ginsengisoli TaxID=904295 RepID=A0ABT9XWN2_9BACI|nr:cation-translocating P-type ATPase [Neobacillus ginsengisoli]MDQ0199985.1 Cd2+/Zn2+-exporting ATPase [Neobacillus ginsengisoli]
MSEQCCSSNKKDEKEIQSCCISIQAPIKDENTKCCNSKFETEAKLEVASCCSNEKPSEPQCCSSSSHNEKIQDVNSCSRKSSNELPNEPENISCCSSDTSNKTVNKQETTSCCSSQKQPTKPLNQNKNIKIYTIEGMDCGSCAKSIENHLSIHPLVKNVSVNFSTGKMKIEHENGVEEIISEVSKIGYKASLLSKSNKTANVPKNKEGNGLIILSGVLIALGFLGSYNGISSLITTFLYAVAMVISGYKPVKSAFYSIKSRSLDMNVLMSAAAIGAALIGEWFEGATVVWLFALGILLQTKSIEKTRSSIRNLMELAPPEAWVKAGSEISKKPVEEISIGDIIIVKPGDKIPLDGEIIHGESSVNQAPITGESIPVDKEMGDTVYAGTINENGSLEIKVTKLVEDTTISKIIHLVEEAQEQKAPTEAFVDKFARIYTPIVFVLALVIMVLPPTLGFGTWGEWFYKGLELLVVACPCALVISTPVAIVSAIGNAAKNGVLIKGGTFLEVAGAINAIAFDKTGTLTEGKPKVEEIKTLNVSDDELLSLALTLEDYSTHPIAKEIVRYAIEKGVPSKNGEFFKSIVGKGVQATIEGIIYYAGNMKLFEEINTPLELIKNNVQEMLSKGKTVVIIGTQQQIYGIIAVSDTIRETTVSALKGLKQSGINQTVMLTGDNEGTANLIASKANVNRYFAELLPEDKVDAIKQLQNEGHKVAMVGDGINDAPALAVADLGIAMGGAGTDTAMETADIILMADNLEKLPHTIKLSRRALAIIKQNIWFSIIVKIIALALIFPGWLTLWIAVLSDTGAALIVILNAIRLLKVKE